MYLEKGDRWFTAAKVTQDEMAVQERFKEYFMTDEGRVTWQDAVIQQGTLHYKDHKSLNVTAQYSTEFQELHSKLCSFVTENMVFKIYFLHIQTTKAISYE